jgi:NTP pyrophosphatase (non-canonical NTP hydrolase)
VVTPCARSPEHDEQLLEVSSAEHRVRLLVLPTGACIDVVSKRGGKLSMIDLQKIIDQCRDDSKRWFPHTDDDIFFMAACVSGEAGELLNEAKKIRRGTHTYGEQLPKLREEAIDTLIYLAQVLDMVGMDEDAIMKEYTRKRMYNEIRFS